ncbi:MAG: hypothetical protein LBK71_00180 [Verrucomicrobiales bacterium]|jgi:hypothetical protein|nr:hypothetical protein [Verrucomicrobiales bacterium]
MGARFSKLLVARHSPKNKCNAEDGAVLYVKPLANVPLKDHVAHYFLSASDHKTKSKYEWVADAEPFDLDDFIREKLNERQLSEGERIHLEIMFNSIAKLAPGSAVAATYSCRGIENKRMEFTVHRVLF